MTELKGTGYIVDYEDHEKIMNIASKKLFEEMAFSMDVSMEEIADRFYERIIPERDEMIRQLDVE